jgi:cytochrome P450
MPVTPSTVEPRSERPVFDPFDPRWSTDPFPLYAELRERAPIHRNDMGFWVMSRHADCLAVLRDRRSSSDTMNVEVEGGGAPEQFRRRSDKDNPTSAGIVEMRPFLFRDPPDHTRLRGLVAQAFTPKVVESLRLRTRQVVDELLDAALDSDTVDLVTDFAYPLPVRMICELLGVPAGDQVQFESWSHALTRGLDPDFLLTDEAIEARGSAVVQFANYFFELLAERKRSPGDDLLSRLAQAEDGGTVLSETEMLSTCILLLVAGHETIASLISGGTLALLRHPDQLERYRQDPGIHRGAFEEMLRYVSPIQLTTRVFTEKCTFGDVEFSAGDYALLLIASANHDSAEFDDGDWFDITRTGNNHLGLGFGIHHCLGAPLARMETDEALSALLRRAPHLAVATDEIAYNGNVILRGIESLPVAMRG